MAECIERAAAIKSVLRMRRPENSVAQNRMLSIIQMDMLKLPAADVAPVVRCKDCKWFADNNDGSWFGCWLFQAIQIIPEDAPKPYDFCSYGELKMDGGEDR